MSSSSCSEVSKVVILRGAVVGRGCDSGGSGVPSSDAARLTHCTLSQTYCNIPYPSQQRDELADCIV